MIGVVHLSVTPPTPLRTDRLVLRPFRADDLEPLLAFHSDREAVRFVPYPPRDRNQVAAVLVRKQANTGLAADGDLVEFAVETAGTGPFPGGHPPSPPEQ
jgi:RimJ/RimL family protein N-acetyltransferase